MEVTQTDNMFSAVVGYEGVIHELQLIRGWYLNKRDNSSNGVNLPGGILFYGRPGNGKTLIAREFIHSFKAPVIQINGDGSNPAREISRAFEELSKHPFAILFVDEIDLLVHLDEQITRIFQSRMEGFDTHDNQFLVVATSNNPDRIPEALKRAGRFDRLIHIDQPDRRTLVQLYEFYGNKVGLKGIDYEFLSYISSKACCADIKNVCSDAYLRKGEHATTEDVEEAYNRLVNRSFDPFVKHDSPWFHRVAVHEMGHAVMLHKHATYLKFYRSNFIKGGGGICHFFPIDELENSYELYLAKIEVALAGYYAEKLIYGNASLGVSSDLDTVRNLIAALVNRHGLIAPNYSLPPIEDPRTRAETEITRHRNERMHQRIYRDITKKVDTYIRQHKAAILELANRMLKTGYVKNETLVAVLGENRKAQPNFMNGEKHGQ